MLGFQDEVWWSRLARPELHAWAGGEPMRLHEPAADAADRDPKALACYGLLRGDTGGMMLRFVAGRPVSQVTEDFLAWACERLAAEGKRALLLVWDNASLARQPAGPGLDQGAQPPGEGRGRACGSWRASCR